MPLAQLEVGDCRHADRAGSFPGLVNEWFPGGGQNRHRAGQNHV